MSVVSHKKTTHQFVDTEKRFLCGQHRSIPFHLFVSFHYKRKMRFSLAAVASLWAYAAAFAPLSSVPRHVSRSVAAVKDLSIDAIGDMTFRELQNECKSRGLSSEGTTATLRSRIRESIGPPVDPFSHEVFEEVRNILRKRTRTMI
jgi:hypothetical protein